MRATERKLRDKHKKIPDKYKKIDTTVNGDAERLAEEHKEVERKLYPLRIDHRTVIYVPKEKCTPEYAEKKRKQFNIISDVENKGGLPRIPINMEELKKLVLKGEKSKDIAVKFGVSRTTIANYIKRCDLRKFE